MSVIEHIVKIERKFQEYCEPVLDAYHVSSGLFHYVIYVGKHPNCSMGEVAMALHMDKGHTTRCIKRLIDLGYVEKQTDGKDQRIKTLILSEDGQVVFLHLYHLFVEFDLLCLQSLNEVEKQSCQRLLEKMEGACNA